MIKLNFWERLNLTSLLILLGLPTLLLTEIILTKKLHPLLVLINISIIALLSIIFIRRQYPSPKIQLGSLITSPLCWIFLLQLILVTIIFSAYLALPDVDPYHWIKSYQQKFLLNHLSELPQRPLFHTLIYTLDQVPYLTAETIFKYVIPLISLLVLMPIYLVAKKLDSKLHQSLLLLAPLLSPALILNMQMGTPQAILLLLTIFFVFFLIYSHLTQNKLWYFVAAATILLATFIHGLALLIFATWLAVTAWHHPKRSYFFLLLLAITILATPYLKAYLPQILSDVRPNLAFPTTFTNIDGVPNAWPGLFNILQYYAFYLGLVAPTIIIATVYLCIRYHSYRRHVSTLMSSRPALVLITMAAGFFLIAETLPRFFNIAILPDRAWLFFSLSSTIFLIPLLTFKTKNQKVLLSFLLLLFAINTSGAIYVNSLKQHLLPDYLVSSARWINNNLPTDSTVLLNRKPEYIELYAPVTFIPLPPDFYCRPPDKISTQLSQTSASYLYFLKPDPRNPYAQRPWSEPLNMECNQPTLNKYPDRFQQIYNDNDQAIIWKIL